MKIGRFMSHIDSMARQNRYQVTVHAPSIGVNMRGMRISKATIPGRKFTTETYSEIPSGPVRKYLQKVEYDQEVTLTFLTDNTLEDRMAIEAWMESMYDYDYGMRYLYNEDGTPGYGGTVTLTQLDRGDFPIYSVTLINAFPESLTGFSLDSSSSAIQTFDVTFGYRQWSSAYENAPADSILGALFDKAGRKIKGKVKRKIEDKIFRERGLASKIGNLI